MESLKNQSYPFDTSIDKASINELPLYKYDGPIHIVDTPNAASEAIEVLNGQKLLGFDTESRPAFTKGTVFDPSLVQLATPSATYLFQLQKIGGLTPLIPLLSNENITKAGVAIADDLTRLKRMEHFRPGGFVEITTHTEALGIENKSLRALIALLFGRRISKNAQVSNWANEQLTAQQITYAATDAYASLCIFQTIQPYI